MTDHSPPDLISRTIKFIRENGIIAEGDRVLIGCSGGMDSSTLLFVLSEIRKRGIPFDLGVAHVNHLLRGSESERDEDFVRAAAAAYGIPFFLKRADVRGYAVSHGLSLQHAGRDIRYGFLDETADKEGFTRIATAHNRDDQIETFVLRLIKGSGLRGLSSIPPVRNRLIRPFLNVYRSEIERFAGHHAITFVEDSSNEKVVYERNFIRHRIVPLLSELNPAFREKIASLLGDINAVNALFDREKDAFMRLVRASRDEISIPLKDFADRDGEVRYRIMADIFARLSPSFVPLREHVRLIEKIVGSPRPNLRVDLPSGLKVLKVYETLIFTTRPLSAEVNQTSRLDAGVNHIALLNIDVHVKNLQKLPPSFPKNPYIAYFDADRCAELSLRTFKPGDRFQPLGMAHTVKVKDFLISRKIPLKDRKHVPLILSGDTIIWIVGHRIDERYRLTGHTRNVLKITVKKTCQP